MKYYSINVSGDRRTFTTGMVAKICQVAPRTVSKWCDTGRLKHYRVPGSNDRRIPRQALLDLMRESGMPVPLFLTEDINPVLVGHPDRIANTHSVDTLLDLGLRMATLSALGVVLSWGLGLSQCVEASVYLKRISVPVAVIPHPEWTDQEREQIGCVLLEGRDIAGAIATWARMLEMERKGDR